MAKPNGTGGDRGIRFFFWLSASLFLLAAANWTFNTFIAISGQTSYAWGIVVLLLAILLTATLLMSAYHGVPQVRKILDGVLGLNKAQQMSQESSSDKDGPKRKTYVELVTEDHRMGNDDIALLFSSEVDAYTSTWTFFVGLVMGFWIAAPSIVLAAVAVGPPELVTMLAKIALLVSLAVGLTLLAGVLVKLALPKYGKTPDAFRMKRFKEYLDAKDAIAERDKNREQPKSTEGS